MKAEYSGLKLGRLLEVDLNSDAVLVRRSVAEAQLAKQVPAAGAAVTRGDGATPAGQPQAGGPSPAGGPVAARRPRRFYAKVALDPNRPTPQVSNIAQSILSELDRVRGTRMTLTLDIAAEAAEGFPEDVENVVRDNAASLRINDFGFEEE
jgi:hypothetical protein